MEATPLSLLLAFQCLPALLLLAGIRKLPDSPRYLASVGRTNEAREVLEHVRGRYDAAVEQEFNEIVAVAGENKSGSPIEFIRIILGLDKSKGAHFGRRAWLCIWLQIMASWTGITAVTAYSPVLLSQAGYSAIKQNGLAGGLNTIGIVGTIISAQIVDRYGRRQCLMWGAAGLSIVNLIVSPISPKYNHFVLTCEGRLPLRGISPRSVLSKHHRTSRSHHAVLVQSRLRCNMGHNSILDPDRDIPKRDESSRKRLRHHRLGYWGWLDSPCQSDYVQQH